jgi:hypothetical protein
MNTANTLLPTKSLGLLMAIGLIDLLATALLHAQGMIVELNPIMRPFIERSEWLFAAVKGMTLLMAYVVMVSYAKHNLEFVRLASRLGVILYAGIWTIWFTAAM